MFARQSGNRLTVSLVAMIMSLIGLYEPRSMLYVLVHQDADPPYGIMLSYVLIVLATGGVLDVVLNDFYYRPLMPKLQTFRPNIYMLIAGLCGAILWVMAKGEQFPLVSLFYGVLIFSSTWIAVFDVIYYWVNPRRGIKPYSKTIHDPEA